MAYSILCVAGCWDLDILCGSLRGSAGSDVLNLNVMLCVSIWTFCVGVSGCQQEVTYWIEMYCFELVFGHFVWDGVVLSRE